jgi:membrane protein
LIWAERQQKATDPPQFQTQLDELIDFDAPVEHLLLSAAEQTVSERMLEGGLGGASALERPPSVLDARDEALLQHARDVQCAQQRSTLAGAHDQLERRLAEAVLEVLTAQTAPVHRKQPLSLRAHDKRHALSGVLAWVGTRDSGRHASMSSATDETPPSKMNLAKVLHLGAVDRLQREHAPLAFAVGVLKKYSEDQGGQLAALITYYGFISLFPLLLVFVTILGFILDGNPSLREQIEHGTLGKFPLLGSSLKLHALSGSGVALAIGLVLTLLGGLAITNIAQFSLNRMWGVPFRRRPDFFMSRLRGLRLLAILGLMTVLSSVAGGFVGASEHGSVSAWQLIAGVIVSLLVNCVLFSAAFRLLTAARIPWRDHAPGVAVATVLFTALQYFGGLYVSHELKHTSPLYGSFALVLGLLAWLYLCAHATLLAIEVNVVRAHRFWPRTLFGDELLESDKRAISATARIQERVDSERIHVRFEDHDPAP